MGLRDKTGKDVQGATNGGLWLSVLLLLALLILPGLVKADHAYLEAGMVYLPVVEDEPYNLSMELRLVPSTFPVQFVLEHSARTNAALTASSAYYDGNFLIVPEIWIGNVSYWAELKETGRDRFLLDSYGRNTQQTIPRTEPYQHQMWEELPGEALDIGVGADGTVWAVGTNESGYGDYNYGLYSWNGRRWNESSGSAVRVDVDPLGRPWVINIDNEIWRQERSGGWVRIPGAAHDIGIGADGSVWVLGATERRGGYEIFTLGSRGWLKVEGSAVRIDVDPTGVPWVINHNDEIYRLENGLWRRIPGKAKDIGIGADGSVWVIGADERAGGYGIYRYNGTGWDKIPGSASQISVGPDGAPWVVNRDRYIYRSLGF